jgi:diacylglycerol kinase
MNVRRFLRSFEYASIGLIDAFDQFNMWVHLAAAITTTAFALWLQVNLLTWAVLVLTIGFVFALELINTALESLVDLVSPNYHPLAKRVKDVGAGAVLVAAATAVLVGLLLLGPPLWARLVGN